jgi:hypothetical protein
VNDSEWKIVEIEWERERERERWEEEILMYVIKKCKIVNER